MIPTIFDICRPRPDVLDGTVADADFAADLAQVLTGKASADYREPGPFFANTYPTRGLKNLLANVCRRLTGAGDAVGAIFRLDTSYGGGKTHGLIALAHAARGMTGVSDVAEFIDPTLLPAESVRVAAFDGENADPMNGRALDGGVLAYTPWGEIAHALAGKPGYERVRRSDEERVAPGSETLRALFGDAPTLILLDELSVYLRKVGRLDAARGQLTAFLTSLFKAVESAPNAAPRLHARHRQGRARDRRLLDGKPVRRGPNGRDREHLRTQGDAPESDGRGRDRAGAPAAPVRGRRRNPGGRGRRRLPRIVDRPSGRAARRGLPARDGGPIPRKLPAAPARHGDADRQDRHALQLPASARDAAAARAYRRPPLAAAAR